MEPIAGQTVIEQPAQQLDFLGTINAEFDSIESLKEKIKIAKEKLASELQQHGGYVVANEDAKNAREKLKLEKTNVFKNETVASLNQELNDLKFDLKEKKEILSDVTVSYSIRENREYVDLPIGRFYIQKSARLVKTKPGK